MELIFLRERDLQVLDHASCTDNFEIVLDSLVPQKSKFTISKKTVNVENSDLVVVRENTEDFQRGLETKCIVCGLEREKIEKLYSHDKNAFDNHINIYHNAFNYIYYLMYLQSSAKKDPIIEKNIWDIHLKKDLSYLPKKVCFKQNEDRIWEKLNQRKNEKEKENQ